MLFFKKLSLINVILYNDFGKNPIYSLNNSVTYYSDLKLAYYLFNSKKQDKTNQVTQQINFFSDMTILSSFFTNAKSNSKSVNNKLDFYIYAYFYRLSYQIKEVRVHYYNLGKLNNLLNFLGNTCNYEIFFLKNHKSNVLSFYYVKLVNLKVNYYSRIRTKMSKLTNTLQINFQPSDCSKNFPVSSNKLNIMYLRKNKVFNKGRYSRSRQIYRTGVYWCLYINLIAIIGIYFWFYRFSMNFGYLWWILYIFFFSFIFSRILKFRLYNLSHLVSLCWADSVFFINLLFTKITLYLSKITSIVFIYKDYFNFFKASTFYSFLFNNMLNLFILVKFLRISKNSIFLWKYGAVNYYLYFWFIQKDRIIVQTKQYLSYFM